MRNSADFSPLIHIGYAKCASTFLQRKVFRPGNRFFPLTLDGSGPGAIARANDITNRFVFDPDGYVRSSFDLARSNVAGAICELPVPEGMRPVLSDERLAGNAHAGGYDASSIADRIRATFPNAKILIMIRSQPQVIVSSYFQYLKLGGVLKFEDYVSRTVNRRSPYFSPAHFCYHRLIGYYQSQFGRANVRVLPMEMLTTCPADLLAAIGAFAGVGDLGGVDPSERVNSRDDQRGLESTRLLNYLFRRDAVNGYSPVATRATKPAITVLRRVVHRLSGTKRTRDGNERKYACIDRMFGASFARSNTETARLTGLDLASFGYAVEPDYAEAGANPTAVEG